MTNLEAHWQSKGLGPEYRLLQKYITVRGIGFLSDLPEVSHNRVLCALQHARRLFPAAKIYLVGSYANGAYRDDSTPGNVFRAFKTLYGKKGHSDVDFWIEENEEQIKLCDYAEIIPDYRGYKVLINDRI